MTETISQVWRDDEESKQAIRTRSFFSHEVGHLVLHEQIKERGFNFDLESVGIKIGNSTTAHIHAKPARIPFARPVSTPSKANYILLKRYAGFITSRNDESFAVRLYEKTDAYPVMEAEFDLEELSESDRELAVEGAALVWTIGYHEDGSRKRESLIYIRRRPFWNKKEVEQAKQMDEELMSDIHWK